VQLQVKTQNGLAVILTAFILLIVGIVFAGVIGDSVYDNTNIYTIENETFAGIDSTAVVLNNIDFVAVSEVRTSNDSVTVETGDYTVVLAAGSIEVTNGTRDYSADYTYFPPNYVKNSTSRALMSLLTLFFVIGLVGIGIGASMKSMKDWMGDGRM